MPFNFKRARLASVNGKVSKNLPPIANKTAKIIKIINKNTLKPLEIFFDATRVKSLNKKYKPTTINNV